MLGRPSENCCQLWRPLFKMLVVSLCQMMLWMWEVQGSSTEFPRFAVG